MSDNTVSTAEQQRRPHLFQPGQSGNPAGRPKGSRNRLAENFVSDLADAWHEHGADALARCAKDEPAQFCRIVASLLPKDINLNVAVSAEDFAAKFRSAYELLGNEPPPRLRRQLPGERAVKVIEHER